MIKLTVTIDESRENSIRVQAHKTADATESEVDWALGIHHLIEASIVAFCQETRTDLQVHERRAKR